MDDSSSSIALIVSLIFVNAFITLAYAAIANARQSELQEQADEGNNNASNALKLLDARSRVYITYNLATTLLTIAVAVVGIYIFLLPGITGESELAAPFALVAVFAIGLVSFSLGNVLPEAVGSAYAMPLIPLVVPPLRAIVILFTPLTALLLLVSRGLARLLGSDQLINTVTEEEIMTLVNAGHTGGTIEDEEKSMIYSVLQLDQTIAREMMIPRIDVTAVEVNTPINEAMDVFIKTGYSRIPVYEDNIDNIVGLLYAKDILNLMNNGGLTGHTVREMLRSAYFVPESKPAHELLRELQTRKVHMAIVVDEYGGTSGLLTIENIIEEIVGDIRDEYDHNEEYEYIKMGESEYVIDAGMDLDDINAMLDINLSTDDTDTLGGFIYLNIGRVPIVGEVIETDKLILQVRSLEGRRIRKVLVTVKPDIEQDTDTSQLSSADDEPEQLADLT